MNELETELVKGGALAIVIVLLLGSVIIRFITAYLSNYAWEAGKKSHKYQGILK